MATDLSVSQGPKVKQGKKEQKLPQYEAMCLRRIQEFEAQIQLYPVKGGHPMRLVLQKRKLAQVARLKMRKNKMNMANNTKKFELMV